MFVLFALDHKAALFSSSSVCWLFLVSYFLYVWNLREITFFVLKSAISWQTLLQKDVHCKYKYWIAFCRCSRAIWIASERIANFHALLTRCIKFAILSYAIHMAREHRQTVIPRKTEFSENCLSPRPKPNIEKNVIWIRMFLFLNSDVTLWSVKMITFRLVQVGFLGSKINLNLPNVIKSPCRPTKSVYGSHLKDVFACKT